IGERGSALARVDGDRELDEGHRVGEAGHDDLPLAGLGRVEGEQGVARLARGEHPRIGPADRPLAEVLPVAVVEYDALGVPQQEVEGLLRARRDLAVAHARDMALVRGIGRRVMAAWRSVEADREPVCLGKLLSEAAWYSDRAEDRPKASRLLASRPANG